MFRLAILTGLLVRGLATAAPVPVPDPTKDRDGLPLPKGAIARLGSLVGTAPDGGAAFTADGKQLVIANAGYRVVIDVETLRPSIRQQVASEPASGPLPVVRASGTGVRVLAVQPSEDRKQYRIVRTSADTGKVLSENRIDAERVRQTAVLGDGSTFALVRTNEIELHDLDTGKRTHALTAEVPYVFFTGMTADRNRLYAREPASARILRWDLTTGQAMKPISLGGKHPQQALSGDGKWLAAGREIENPKEKPNHIPTYRMEIDVLDLATEKVTRTVKLDRNAVLHAVGDNGLLVQLPGSVVRYSLTTGEKEWEFVPVSPSYRVFAVHDTRVAVRTYEGKLDILDAGTGKRVGPAADGRVFNPRFSADGTSIFAVSGGRLQRWTGEGKSLDTPAEWANRRLSYVRTAKPADRLAEVASKPGAGATYTLFEVGKEAALSSFEAPVGSVLQSVAPDDGMVFEVTAEGKKSFLTTDPKTGKVVGQWQSYPEPKWQPGGLVLSGDGRIGVVREKGLPMKPTAVVGLHTIDGTEAFRVPAEKVADLSPSGCYGVNHDASLALFLPAGGRGGLMMLDIKGQGVTPLTPRFGTGRVQFDPTGTRLAVWNFTPTGVAVFDLKAAGGPKERIIEYPFGQPSSADISPDGKRLVANFADGSTLLWDLTSK